MAVKRSKTKKRVSNSSKDLTPKSVKKIEKAFSKKKLMLYVGIFIIVALIVLIGGSNAGEIKEGNKIKIDYVGTLDDGGTIFDSSQGKEPLEFVVGNGDVIEGFEKGVLGMKVGDKKTIHIPYEQAYGAYDSKRTAEYPLENVPENMELSVGASVVLQSSETGGVILAKVLEIGEEYVVLDLNHPLAGKNLNFDVEIVEVN